MAPVYPSNFEVIPDDLLELATPAERRAYSEALQAHLAKRSPLDFALVTRPEAVEYPHARLISDKIASMPPDSMLLIMMPPRAGKSFIISETLPSWVHANDPNARILHATYAADFTRMFGLVSRNLMQQSMPLTPRLDPQAKSAVDYHIHPKEGRGFYRGTGVGGPLTGLGGDWIILDDLIKNDEEGRSQIIRDNTWNWLVSTALSRREPGSRVIMVGTPWNEDDVLHRAMATGEWDVLRLPALAEEDDPLGREIGEALNPERHDVAYYESVRAMDPRVFNALYQCRPAPEDGDVFKKQGFRYAENMPEKAMRFATVDLAHSTKSRADYSVIMVFAATAPPHPKLYVTHVFRERVPSDDHIAWFDRCMESIPVAERPIYAGIEDKTFGSTMLATARRHGRAGKVPFRPLKADADKYTRALPAATLMSQGQIVFRKDAPWLADLEHELLVFDNGKHDDQVDTLAYGALEFSKSPQLYKPPPPPPPKTASEKASAQIKRMRKAAKGPSRKALMKG